MAERISFSSGGRPHDTENWPSGRTTAAPFPATWIPILLGILMIFVAIWSWWVLRDGLRNHSFLEPADSDVNATTLADDSGGTPIDAIEHGQITLAQGFSPQVLYWSNAISTWAVEYDLDPNLIALVMQIESCGYANARSSAGALGLFQVMPFHFQPDEDPFDPEVNAKRGLAYFAGALQLAEGQLDLALAGYNGGHAVISRDSSRWPEETRRYVSWGVRIFSEVTRGHTDSSTLQSWLLAGGERLCRLAAQTQTHHVRLPSESFID